ncbi:hypothetical protein Dimus_030027 [Dionaea muscipula]
MCAKSWLSTFQEGADREEFETIDNDVMVKIVSFQEILLVIESVDDEIGGLLIAEVVSAAVTTDCCIVAAVLC